MAHFLEVCYRHTLRCIYLYFAETSADDLLDLIPGGNVEMVCQKWVVQPRRRDNNMRANLEVSYVDRLYHEPMESFSVFHE